MVWYSGQFWALYFLQQVSKVDALTTAYIVGAGLIIGTPTLIFFGWLSDHIGRKPVILGGMLLAAVTYYPLYAWLGSATQPGNINYPIAIIIIAILVAYVGMVYGPIGACRLQHFLGHASITNTIRYTAMSPEPFKDVALEHAAFAHRTPLMRGKELPYPTVSASSWRALRQASFGRRAGKIHSKTIS